MLQDIKTVFRSQTEGKLFSILVPTWNNLPYLRLTVESLRKNSHFSHQIIVAVNDGADGSLDWIMEQPDIDYIHAPHNIGVCYALNACRKLIRTEYVAFANDDMYFLPDWDLGLKNEIDRIGNKNFMLSGTMIEAKSRNPCCIVADYGIDAADFREKDLLCDQPKLIRADWSGSTWPPNVVHIDLWDLIGGLSLEFSPGMGSDPDFSKKLWEAGVRTFIGKGDSLVYHFARKTTGRIKENNGRKTFLLKWGLTPRTFTTRYLRLGQEIGPPLTVNGLPIITRWRNRLKCFAACLK